MFAQRSLAWSVSTIRHDLHKPVHDELQQNPSTQKPFTQSVLVAHVSPSISLHTPLESHVFEPAHAPGGLTSGLDTSAVHEPGLGPSRSGKIIGAVSAAITERRMPAARGAIVIATRVIGRWSTRDRRRTHAVGYTSVDLDARLPCTFARHIAADPVGR